MVNRLKQLKDSIAILAGGIEDQLDYLIATGHNNGKVLNDSTNIDEIALQFEDADYATRGLAENGEISDSARIAIAKLSSELLSYAGKDSGGFWTVKALKSDARWFRIRELASHSLKMIGND